MGLRIIRDGFSTSPPFLILCLAHFPQKASGSTKHSEAIVVAARPHGKSLLLCTTQAPSIFDNKHMGPVGTSVVVSQSASARA
ncbi:hypothetical protein C2857_004937, partial [Epichloe festucae Fl1]